MATDSAPEGGKSLLSRLWGPRIVCPGTVGAVVGIGFAVAALLYGLSLPPEEEDSPADDPAAVEQTLPNHDIRMDEGSEIPASAPSEDK